MKKNDQKKYWKTNLKYLAILLSIWFIVSFGCGILFVDELNTIRMGGFKLGFLVCSTRINLCLYYFNFCVHKVDE